MHTPPRRDIRQQLDGRKVTQDELRCNVGSTQRAHGIEQFPGAPCAIKMTSAAVYVFMVSHILTISVCTVLLFQTLAHGHQQHDT